MGRPTAVRTQARELIRPRRVLVALAALALAAIAFAGVRAVTEDDRPLVIGAVSTTTSVDPVFHLFGDRVTARLDVLVDRREADPKTIRVRAAFGPYGVLGRPAVEREDVGRTTTLRFRYTLWCTEPDCIPGETPTAYPLPQARISYRATSGERRRTVAEWPRLTAASRLAPGEARAFRAERRPPSVSFGVAPLVLQTVALLLAGGLVAAAGLLLARAFGFRRRRVRPAAPPVTLTPLERAVALARQSAGDEARERPALEHLAHVLGGNGRGDLAEAARRLAWSSRRPQPDEVQQLAVSVERTMTDGH